MFKLTIDTDNEQFASPYTGSALAAILIETAHRLAQGSTGGRIMDDNGNDVGRFRLIPSASQER